VIHDLQLTPEMNSRKLQVLGFIKRYYLANGASPTQGEIALGLDVSKTRIQALIRQLDREKLIKRVRGRKRGIMLADGAKQVSAIDALLMLKLEGWSVNPGRLELVPPPLSFPSLPLPPQLDHIPDVEFGVGNDGSSERQSGA